MWSPSSCGYDVLGAEVEIGFDVTEFIKKEGPEVLSAAAEQMKAGDKKPADKKTDKKAEKKSKDESWFTRPVIGPVPGWGVLAGVGVLGLGGYFLLR